MLEGIRIHTEDDLLKSQLKKRFKKAGHNQIQSSFRFLNEVREALATYVKSANIKLTNAVADSLQEKDLTKSLLLHVPSVIGESDDLLLKAAFFRIWDKISKKLRRKKPPEPKDIKVNYDTEREDLLPEDWRAIDEATFDYMNNVLAPATKEMIAEAYRKGVQAGVMAEKGVSQKNISQMSYDQMDHWADTHNLANELAKSGMADDYAYAAAFAEKRAAEGIAVYEDGERKGNAYELAVKMFRNQIREGLANNESASEIRSRLIFPEKWTDVKGHQSKLAENLTDDQIKAFTVAHLNRNFDRFAFNEVQYAFNNGRLLRWSKLADEETAVYVRFDRAYGSTKRSCPFCEANRGTICRLFRSYDEFAASEFYGGEDKVINDKKAKVAVWPGKNNYTRNQANWWICAPVHPYCVDDYILV